MAGDSIKFTSTLDMFDQLNSTPITVAIVGLVKPDEGNADILHFSLHGCGGWVQVPSDMVERYQPLGKTRCGDHQHDAVRLHLKRPEDNTGRVLADLLTQHQAVNVVGPAIANFAAAGGPGCPNGSHWDWKVGHCVPD